MAARVGGSPTDCKHSISRAAPPLRSTLAHLHSPSHSSSANESGGVEIPCVLTPYHSSCSAQACCGSAGSGSTLVRRSLPGNSLRRCFMNTQVATATAALAWVLVERVRDGSPPHSASRRVQWRGPSRSPACGYVTPLGAMAMGLAGGAICSLAVGLKYKFGYDDSLDVVGVHGVGGLVGMIGIGLLATVSVNSARR